MLFSSLTFLFYFLPCAILLYFAVPEKLRNLVLLIASLVFYAWGEPKYILLMLIGITNSYIAGLLIEKYRGSIVSRLVLIISSAISTGCLVWFKYAGFFAENFSRLTGIPVPALSIALPIGISFYTFQMLSYIIDVYRKDAEAQKNPIDLALYVSLFPQLIAGPIVRYSDIALQLRSRTHSLSKAASGIRVFVIGLSKKILLANSLGELCSSCIGADDKSVLLCWIYAIGYSLQIYFDFSGYSDMAVGLGRIFGFEFCRNFNYPFISRSITEFWRRWHMSLGTWFRDYVYIPLGGSRTSHIKWLRNILIVWMLTGFWHGAEWNFILWGLYFGLLLILEKLLLGKLLQNSRILSRVYLIITVLISFVIFSASDTGTASELLSGMLGIGGLPLLSSEQLSLLGGFGVILAAAVIGATPIPAMLFRLAEKNRYGEVLTAIAEPVILAILTLVCTAYLVDGSFNPFLYFRF